MLRRLYDRQALLFGLAAVGLLLILLVHLGSQPKAFSSGEMASIRSSGTLHLLAKNPIDAPHNILRYGLSKLSAGTLSLRLSSVVWGLVFAVSFYCLARAWFGKVIGLVGSVMLVTTPLFLIAARQSSEAVMFLSPVLIMALYAWVMREKTNKNVALPVLWIVCAAFFYVPGVIWWLAGGVFLARRQLKEAASELSTAQLSLSLIAILLVLAPLAVALFGDWRLLKPLALVPTHFSSPLAELKTIGWMISAWFFKPPYHSPLLIDRLPLLNLVQDVLLVFGTYALFQVAKAKAWPLAAVVAFATLAAGLNNDIRMLLLGLPAVGIMMTAGLRYLYIEWRGVFPKNPAAKYLALVLIVSLGIVQLLFGVRYALVAWPHTVVSATVHMLR